MLRYLKSKINDVLTTSRHSKDKVMNPHTQTKQALANLSRKPVNDISMQRLAPMFATQVVNRRKAELQAERDAEDFVHPAFIDGLRAKASKLLNEEAENTASCLPVSSVYDALQITKQHKSANTDAGIRALKGMLTAMWKESRIADIDAETFMKYRDYYNSNFPKSAVSDVFDDIGAKGYAALPVSDLLVMASRIYSQEDYDYEMMRAGLTTKQPHHVKARKFVLAVLTGKGVDHRQAQGMFDEDPFAQLSESVLSSGLPEEDIQGLSNWIKDGQEMLNAGNVKGAEAALYEIRERLGELSPVEARRHKHAYPGKFEGVASKDLDLAQRLYGEIADEEMNTPDGWYGLHRKFEKDPAAILFESDQGFVDIYVYNTDEDAQKMFDTVREEEEEEDFEYEARRHAQEDLPKFYVELTEDDRWLLFLNGNQINSPDADSAESKEAVYGLASQYGVSLPIAVLIASEDEMLLPGDWEAAHEDDQYGKPEGYRQV